MGTVGSLFHGQLDPLARLQKHLYTEMKAQMTPELSRQYSDVLVEIRKAVVALDIGINPSERAEK
ncbi:TPA: hypothetical protein ACXKSV_004280 [Salmonella enterica]